MNNNLASALSLSFGGCEAQIGTANSFYNSLWAQAAAQGISVFVAAGDNGSAGCDPPASSSGGTNTTTPAVSGLAVNGLASTPYNVAVGGTAFNDTASPSTYWNASNDSHNASAKSYIPEVVWNDSNYTAASASGNGLWAGAGGISTLYARPSWQTGAGISALEAGSVQKHRLLPDVSLAVGGRDGYLVYQEGSLYVVGGTSASSPSMAGIMAIVNQYSGGRNGNPNLKFYPLAASTAAVYHDVTTGTNAVPCEGGSPNCSAAKPATNTGVLTGYGAGVGYDLTTGWGSVDAYALASNWGTSLPPVLSITSLNPGSLTVAAAAPALTINGTAFQRGATVKIGGATLPGTSVTFVSSTQLTVSVTETTAGSFPVTVTNPGGATSNSVSLTVNAPGATPNITTIIPNPMTGSNSSQLITINGTGFQSGLTLKIGGTNVASSHLASLSATRLALWVTTGTTAATYPVEVVNPGSVASNTVNLKVVAPHLTISSLIPNPVAVSSTVTPLIILGAGFQLGLKVTVGPAIYSGQQVIITDTFILLFIVPGTKATSLNVQVLNPDGQQSNVANLKVQ